MRWTAVSIIGLVAGQFEEASLLQTSSRDRALASRAHNSAKVEEEDELDDALGGKSCTTWLADEAVANAHDEIEVFRTQMAAHGYQRAVKKSVKIGAYCPAIIADTTLTFLDSPCEDRNQVARVHQGFEGDLQVLQGGYEEDDELCQTRVSESDKRTSTSQCTKKSHPIQLAKGKRTAHGGRNQLCGLQQVQQHGHQ